MTDVDKTAAQPDGKTGPKPATPPDRGAPPKGGDDPMPAAGPHADPDLTAPEKTPGAGSLPDPDNPQEGDATTG